MLVVLALAALAILAGVVVVSMGRGGELKEFPPDVPPLNLPDAGQLSAVDFVSLQLPVSLVGYHTQSVDETLHRVAGAISARDTKIAVLEQRVTELLAGRLYARQEAQAGPPLPVRRSSSEHRPGGPDQFPSLPESGIAAAGLPREQPADLGGRHRDTSEPVDGGARGAEPAEQEQDEVTPGDGLFEAGGQAGGRPPRGPFEAEESDVDQAGGRSQRGPFEAEETGGEQPDGQPRRGLFEAGGGSSRGPFEAEGADVDQAGGGSSRGPFEAEDADVDQAGGGSRRGLFEADDDDAGQPDGLAQGGLFDAKETGGATGRAQGGVLGAAEGPAAPEDRTGAEEKR
ncbi:hypothetical protein [Streptosporangium sp. KLBMP 9127]|nr:hypothetical protein [Streptosporangium sp. KLBMP 9127]